MIRKTPAAAIEVKQKKTNWLLSFSNSRVVKLKEEILLYLLNLLYAKCMLFLVQLTPSNFTRNYKIWERLKFSEVDLFKPFLTTNGKY